MGETQVSKYEDVLQEKRTNIAPDGGYGYVICIALCINFMACFCPSSVFGMQYNDFIKETGTGTGSITMVMAFSTTIMSFCGILVNVALKRFSSRQVAMCGAILYTLGWLLNYFITSVYDMFLTIGFLQGSGVAILTTITYTSFNQYFEKKRIIVLSVCQMIICIAQMLYPLLLERLLAIYGFRGSILINTGLIANTIFAAVCFQPVSWHYKERPDCEKVFQELITTNERTMEMIEVNENCTNSKGIDNKQKETDKTQQSIWRTVSKQMDLSLLSDAVYINITIGISITFAADIGFSLLYPLYLYSLEYSTSEVAFLLSLVSGADLVSRALMAVIGHFRQYPSRNIFFGSVMVGIVAKFFFLQFTSFWPLIVTSFLIGFSRGPIQVTVPVIYAEYLPEKFAAAYGLSLLFMGNANTLMFPAAGYIRDVTNSYLASFYCLTFITLASMIPWCYEYWYFESNRYMKRKKKKSVNKS